MKYLVVYEKGPTSYGAFVPDLPGIGVVGKTREEVEQSIRIALQWHLEAMREDNEPIPEPTTWAEFVEVPQKKDTAHGPSPEP